MRYVLGLVVLVSCMPLLPAQSPAGVPGTFRAFVVTDERFEKGNPRNRADKMHCLVVDNGLNPALAIFSRTLPATPDVGVAKLAVKMNTMLNSPNPNDRYLKAERFGAYAIFLTLTREYPEDPKRDDSNNAVKALAKQLNTTSVPFALAAGKSNDVATWGIGDTDDVTVVFYRKMALIKKWTFTADNALNDESIADIASTVEKELRPKKK